MPLGSFFVLTQHLRVVGSLFTHPHNLPNMAVQIVKAPTVHHVAHVLPGSHIGLAARRGRFGHPVVHRLFRVGREAQQHFGGLLRVGDGAFGGHEAGEALGQNQHEVDGRG